MNGIARSGAIITAVVDSEKEHDMKYPNAIALWNSKQIEPRNFTYLINSRVNPIPKYTMGVRTNGRMMKTGVSPKIFAV